MAFTQATSRPDWRNRLGKIDRVLLTIMAIFIILAVFAPAQVPITAGAAIGSLLSTAPFLVLSIGIAAYVGASGADNLIAQVFQGRTTMMVFTAALFGALSPFCSCGVIPIIAALLTMGVPLAPVMAFWLASPIMDPSMFVMTSAVLGVDFAIAKTIAAIGVGLLGGFGVMWLGRFSLYADPLREGVGDGGCGASSVRQPKPIAWAFWRDQDRVIKFRKAALKNGWFLGKWLLLAFVLESLMLAYVPAEWISQSLGGEGVVPIALATLVGVPAYLNGYAALPLMGGLLQQGMAPGAALTFMVAGGVTSIPAAIAVWALAKKQVFFAYVAFALGGSFAAGLVFEALMAG